MWRKCEKDIKQYCGKCRDEIKIHKVWLEIQEREYKKNNEDKNQRQERTWRTKAKNVTENELTHEEIQDVILDFLACNKTRGSNIVLSEPFSGNSMDAKAPILGGAVRHGDGTPWKPSFGSHRTETTRNNQRHVPATRTVTPSPPRHSGTALHRLHRLRRRRRRHHVRMMFAIRTTKRN